MTIEITYILISIFISFISIFSFLYLCYRHCLAGYEISYYHEKYLGLDEGEVWGYGGDNGNIRNIKEEVEEEVRRDMPKLVILQNPAIYLEESPSSIESKIYFTNHELALSCERFHPDAWLRKIVIVEDIYERYQSGIQKGTK